MAYPSSLGKRMILCLDGTWMDSDNGYQKSGFFSPHGTLQVPSNVTRISRCFKRRCSDGRLQIISYESGVGTGSSTIDKISGGAFGLGLSEVRQSRALLYHVELATNDANVSAARARGVFLPVRKLHGRRR